MLEPNIGKSHMLIIPSVDINHVMNRMFGTFFFRHSNIGSSALVMGTAVLP